MQNLEQRARREFKRWKKGLRLAKKKQQNQEQSTIDSRSVKAKWQDYLSANVTKS